MPRGPGRGGKGRELALIAACLLAIALFRPAPFGFRLAVDRGGVSLLLKAGLARVAFEIGQACSNPDSGQ